MRRCFITEFTGKTSDKNKQQHHFQLRVLTSSLSETRLLQFHSRRVKGRSRASTKCSNVASKQTVRR